MVDVIAFGAGGILLYSAIKDDNPVDVVKAALQGKTATSYKDGTATTTKLPPGKQYVDGSGDSPGTHTSSGGVGPGTPVVYQTPPTPVYVSV